MAAPIFSEANSVIGFAKHLKSAYDYFLEEGRKTGSHNTEYSHLSELHP